MFPATNSCRALGGVFLLSVASTSPALPTSPDRPKRSTRPAVESLGSAAGSHAGRLTRRSARARKPLILLTFIEFPCITYSQQRDLRTRYERGPEKRCRSDQLGRVRTGLITQRTRPPQQSDTFHPPPGFRLATQRVVQPTSLPSRTTLSAAATLPEENIEDMKITASTTATLMGNSLAVISTDKLGARKLATL